MYVFSVFIHLQDKYLVLNLLNVIRNSKLTEKAYASKLKFYFLIYCQTSDESDSLRGGKRPLDDTSQPA